MSRTVDEHQRVGFRFRLIDMVSLATFLVILFSIIVMVLESNRRGSLRRARCGNNLRQLGLSILNFESSHGRFPAAIGDPMFASAGIAENRDRLSGLILLLPYLERGNIYDPLFSGQLSNGACYPALGPSLADQNYPIWQFKAREFLCPISQRLNTSAGQSNYAFCIGDRVYDIHQAGAARGAFQFGTGLRIAQFLDGTSNTIMMAEIGNSNDGRRAIGNVAIYQPTSMLESPVSANSLTIAYSQPAYRDGVKLGAIGRGGRWYDGAANYSLFNTILPPNSASVAIGGAEAVDGIYSAGSEHSGYVTTLFADASVSVISEKIDCGKPGVAPLLGDEIAPKVSSPFGVWGALGTIDGAEVIDSSQF